MGLEQIIKYLLGEAKVIGQAPAAFFACVLVTGAIVWIVLRWRYVGVVSTLEERVRLRDDRIAEYKEKLSGASPDEARAKIAALERTINSTIGQEWEPLSRDEVRRLSNSVRLLEKRKIQIMYANQLGKNLAQSISDAFEDAGWPVHFSEGGGLGVGVSTGRGSGMALTLKQAIEGSTGLKVGSFGPDEPDTPGIVFVAVGINPV